MVRDEQLFQQVNKGVSLRNYLLNPTDEYLAAVKANGDKIERKTEEVRRDANEGMVKHRYLISASIKNEHQLTKKVEATQGPLKECEGIFKSKAPTGM